MLAILTAPNAACRTGPRNTEQWAAVNLELAEIQAIGGSGELFLNKDSTLDQIRAAVEHEVPSAVSGPFPMQPHGS